jgi:hypothetical protein
MRCCVAVKNTDLAHGCSPDAQAMPPRQGGGPARVHLHLWPLHPKRAPSGHSPQGQPNNTPRCESTVDSSTLTDRSMPPTAGMMPLKTDRNGSVSCGCGGGVGVVWCGGGVVWRWRGVVRAWRWRGRGVAWRGVAVAWCGVMWCAAALTSALTSASTAWPHACPCSGLQCVPDCMRAH